jgi:hypothetical protein
MSELKFKPVGNFVLIKPLALRGRTEDQVVLDDEANVGKNPVEDEMITKVVKNKINYKEQLAEVLSIGTLDPDKTPYKVGDIVVYPLNGTMELGLVKGQKLIYAHNILGVWIA